MGSDVKPIAIVHYNGGIPSYILLKYAIKNNLKPILLYIYDKKENPELFRIPDIYRVLKKYIKLPYIEINNKKEISKFISLNKNILEKIHFEAAKISNSNQKNSKFYFLVNDTDFESNTTTNKKLIIQKQMKRFFYVRFFSDIYKKEKNFRNLYKGAKCIPISLHKKITKYKLGKEYSVSTFKNDLLKNRYFINTMIFSSKDPPIKIKYKILKESFYDDFKFLIIAPK